VRDLRNLVRDRSIETNRGHVYEFVDVSTIEDAADFLEAFSAMKRAIVRSAWRIFSPLELGPMQATLMRELSRGGAVAQADLARATANDPAATSRAVQSLVDLGWVRRTPSEEDRRVLVVETTDAGKRAMKRLDAAYASLGRSMVNGLTARDLADFKRVAQKVAAHDAAAESPKKKPRRVR
jgi:DNA-binding MarR family transcriptional regulator